MTPRFYSNPAFDAYDAARPEKANNDIDGSPVSSAVFLLFGASAQKSAAFYFRRHSFRHASRRSIGGNNPNGRDDGETAHGAFFVVEATTRSGVCRRRGSVCDFVVTAGVCDLTRLHRHGMSNDREGVGAAFANARSVAPAP